jgi:hypothetical protein
MLRGRFERYRIYKYYMSVLMDMDHPLWRTYCHMEGESLEEAELIAPGSRRLWGPISIQRVLASSERGIGLPGGMFFKAILNIISDFYGMNVVVFVPPYAIYNTLNQGMFPSLPSNEPIWYASNEIQIGQQPDHISNQFSVECYGSTGNTRMCPCQDGGGDGWNINFLGGHQILLVAGVGRRHWMPIYQTEKTEVDLNLIDETARFRPMPWWPQYQRLPRPGLGFDYEHGLAQLGEIHPHPDPLDSPHTSMDYEYAALEAENPRNWGSIAAYGLNLGAWVNVPTTAERLLWRGFEESHNDPNPALPPTPTDQLSSKGPVDANTTIPQLLSASDMDISGNGWVAYAHGRKAKHAGIFEVEWPDLNITIPETAEY